MNRTKTFFTALFLLFVAWPFSWIYAIEGLEDEDLLSIDVPTNVQEKIRPAREVSLKQNMARSKVEGGQSIDSESDLSRLSAHKLQDLFEFSENNMATQSAGFSSIDAASFIVPSQDLSPAPDSQPVMFYSRPYSSSPSSCSSANSCAAPNPLDVIRGVRP